MNKNCFAIGNIEDRGFFEKRPGSIQKENGNYLTTISPVLVGGTVWEDEPCRRPGSVMPDVQWIVSGSIAKASG